MSENRFRNLKEKTTTELITELENEKNELEFMKKALENAKESSEKKSEFLSSDIPFSRDKIEYIETELKRRGIK